MKHTSSEVLTYAKELLLSLGCDYFFEDTFKVFNTQEDEWLKKKVEEKVFGIIYPSNDIWMVWVNVPGQFGDDGVITLDIADDPLAPVALHDVSYGRAPALRFVKQDGKYVLGEPWAEI